MLWNLRLNRSTQLTFTGFLNWVLPFWQNGITCNSMKTLTLKLPDSLAVWLENEAKRVNRPKSELIRDVLRAHQEKRARTAFDLAADLCGSVESGKGDLSHNKKYMKGFGQ